MGNCIIPLFLNLVSLLHAKMLLSHDKLQLLDNNTVSCSFFITVEFVKLQTDMNLLTDCGPVILLQE